jgi:hypothetical protein
MIKLVNKTSYLQALFKNRVSGFFMPIIRIKTEVLAIKKPAIKAGFLNFGSGTWDRTRDQ